MRELHFKKVPGGAYQILFYVGDFYVPVEENLVKELKKQTQNNPEEFLKFATEKLGYTAYLKTAIQEVLNTSNDHRGQAKTLMNEILDL